MVVDQGSANQTEDRESSIQGMAEKRSQPREAWGKWYDQIETTEGKKSSYIIVKQMAASRKDVGGGG